MEETSKLQAAFQANGYPRTLTRRIPQRPLKKTAQPEPHTEDETTESKKLLILPYVKDVSEKIERIAAPLGVKTVFRSGNTLRQTLIDVKYWTPHKTKKGVVYKVPCADCGHVHIGETGQTLKRD